MNLVKVAHLLDEFWQRNHLDTPALGELVGDEEALAEQHTARVGAGAGEDESLAVGSIPIIMVDEERLGHPRLDVGDVVDADVLQAWRSAPQRLRPHDLDLEVETATGGKLTCSSDDGDDGHGRRDDGDQRPLVAADPADHLPDPSDECFAPPLQPDGGVEGCG